MCIRTVCENRFQDRVAEAGSKGEEVLMSQQQRQSCV